MADRFERRQLLDAEHRFLRVLRRREHLDLERLPVRNRQRRADVLRARVDVLRLAGDLKEARALVGPLAASPTGENAYVLAALDLADAQPERVAAMHEDTLRINRVFTSLYWRDRFC